MLRSGTRFQRPLTSFLETIAAPWESNTKSKVSEHNFAKLLATVYISQEQYSTSKWPTFFHHVSHLNQIIWENQFMNDSNFASIEQQHFPLWALFLKLYKGHVVHYSDRKQSVSQKCYPGYIPITCLQTKGTYFFCYYLQVSMRYISRDTYHVMLYFYTLPGSKERQNPP